MSATPLVSVVVPLRDGERYVGAALESILAQDYAPLEVVVVDDGSTDGGGDVARSFAGVRSIRQDPAGEAATRNRGIRETSGPYVAFLDHDDLWPAGKVAAQVEVLERRPEVGIVLGHLCNFLEPGAPRPSRLAADHLEGRSLQAMLGPALIRRSVFEQIGLFSTEPGIWVDWEWFARAQRAGIVRHVQDEVMLYRRLHDANMSNPLDEKHQRLLNALRLGLAEQRQGSRPWA